jgi:transposase
MKRTTIGLDLAKRVFQVHSVDEQTGEITREKLKREQVLEYFANRESSVVAMEACGSAHYWARQLVQLGHEVRLVSAQFVRPFVKANKTDAADAEAIWEAAQRPGMRYVALKSEEQQAVLGLHRVREMRVRMRVRLVNQLHGVMGEFGIALPKGWRVMLKRAGELLSEVEECPVPGMLREALLDQLQQIRSLSEQIKAMGKASSFKSGREFAAFLGLVPRQSGTGGRVKLLGISKRGDRYLRTLLIHGARTVLSWQRRPGHELDPWLKGLLSRRAPNVVAVALANKMARTIWALLAHGRTYQRGYVGRMAPSAA